MGLPTEFLWTGSQWTLTDKGSSNGTTVNEVKLVEGGEWTGHQIFTNETLLYDH